MKKNSFVILKRYLLLFFIGTLSFLSLKAQTNEPTDSIVIIKEDPVIYKEKIMVEEIQSATFYMSGYYSLFRNYSYYNSCDNCEDFLSVYKSSITPKFGYTVGLGAIYAPNKLIAEFKLGFSSIKEHFEFTDKKGTVIKSNNEFNYLDIALSGGYWLRRNKNISFLVNSGFIYSRLLRSIGMVNNFDKPGSAQSISDSDKIRPNQYSFNIGAKIIFLSQCRIKFYLEPYYTGSIFNIAGKYYPYLELYNKIGGKGGFLFSL